MIYKCSLDYYWVLAGIGQLGRTTIIMTIG